MSPSGPTAMTRALNVPEVARVERDDFGRTVDVDLAHRVSTGKVGSVDSWRMYEVAPDTALHVKVMFSNEWNFVAFRGGFRVDVPGTPAPAPVTVKLLGDDHAPGSTSVLTAWTCQKYVPFARPLTIS